MKKILGTIPVLLCPFLLILLISCPEKIAAQGRDSIEIRNSTPRNPKRIRVQHKSRNNFDKIKFKHAPLRNPEQINAVPIRQTYHDVLRSFAFMAFDYLDASHNPQKPILVESQIKLDAFETYINSPAPSDGIKFYISYDPGSNSLIPIMCHSRLMGSNHTEDAHFILLNKSVFTTQLPAEITSETATTYLHNYFNTIRIWESPQRSPYLTYSRYYTRVELLDFINNTINPLPDSDHSHYSIKIEFGFITESISELLYNMLDNPGDSRPSNYIGFTVMFHIIDSNGEPITTHGTPNSIDYFEVGSPCPPVCGSLY